MASRFGWQMERLDRLQDRLDEEVRRKTPLLIKGSQADIFQRRIWKFQYESLDLQRKALMGYRKD